MFAEMVVYMEAGAVAALLDDLVTIFHLTYDQQGLLGGCVYVTICLGCPLATLLFLRFPPKWVLLVSLIINDVSVVLFFLTPPGWPNTLLGARSLIGFTQAFLCVYAPIWIDFHAPKEAITRWFSFNQASIPAGIVLGYALATVAAQYEAPAGSLDRGNALCAGGVYCWQYPFLVQVCLLVPIILGGLFVPAHLLDYMDHEEPDEEGEGPDCATGVTDVEPEPLHGGEEGSKEGAKEGPPAGRCCSPVRGAGEEVCLILREALFTCIILLLSAIYFVVTGIQYWATDYLTTVLGGQETQVMLLVMVTSATAPISGVFFGGWYIDRQGGYKDAVHMPGEQKLRATTCVLGFGLIAVAVAVPAAFIQSNIYLPTACMWVLLFFGACCMPALTGMYVDAIPPGASPMTGSSLAQLTCNILGFALAPMLSGWLMEYFEGAFSSCSDHSVGHCPMAFLWGFRIVLLWPCIALVFMLAVWVTVYYQWRRAALEDASVFAVLAPMLPRCCYKPPPLDPASPKTPERPLAEELSSPTSHSILPVVHVLGEAQMPPSDLDIPLAPMLPQSLLPVGAEEAPEVRLRASSMFRGHGIMYSTPVLVASSVPPQQRSPTPRSTRSSTPRPSRRADCSPHSETRARAQSQPTSQLRPMVAELGSLDNIGAGCSVGAVGLGRQKPQLLRGSAVLDVLEEDDHEM